MPAHKDLKRLVRSRMRKTGESYTAARAQLVAQRAKQPPRTASNAVVAADPAGIAGMSDEAVRAKTGRTWRQWLRVLDDAGAVAKPHREIARYLHETQGLPGWWAQTVTVGYERIRGLRDVGQRRGGQYEISKSRTVPAALADLYAACAHVTRRRRWLRQSGIVVRTATDAKSLRWTWPDKTSVELLFYAKGSAKSQIVIQHSKLPSRDAATQAKRAWDARLDVLVGVLGAGRVTGSTRSRTASSRPPKSPSRLRKAAPRRR